jgi:hypothetical protein
VGFRGLRKDDPGQHIGIDEDPQLGAFVQAAAGSQGRNTPPSKVPELRLPSLSIRSSKPGRLGQACLRTDAVLEVVGQIHFEQQVAQPPLPLNPEILEVLPF